jgi:hypothetical protein
MLTRIITSSVALTLAASSVGAAAVYTQDFETFTSPGNTIPGWYKSGGFNGNAIVDANVGGNGSSVAFFDTLGTDFLTTTSMAGDTGVAYVPGTPYSFTFTAYKTGTGSNFVGDLLYGLYAGDPTLGTYTGPGTGFATAGTPLVTGTLSNAADGTVTVNSVPTGAGSGNLFVYFFAGVPTNTAGYAQVELDNISISVVPEPTSLAALGAISLIALRRRSAV